MLKQYLGLPRAVHVLCVGAFINRAGAFLAPFLTLYLQDKLNLGTEFATRAMGVYGFGAIAAFLAGGHFADRFGRRTVMLISLLGAALILLIFGSLTSPWAIIAALLVFAFVAEMYRPAASAMIADLVGPARRSQAFGLMYVSTNLGFAVAASAGGILARYSFQWLFFGDALTAFVYAAIIFLTIRETMPRRADQDVVPTEETGSVTGPSPGKDMGLYEALKHILTDWTFLVFWLGSFFLAAMFMQILSTFPLYLNRLGMGPDTYGRVIALNGLMIVFLQLPTTSIVARFHRGVMVTMSAIIMAFGFGLIVTATTAWQLATTVAIQTVGEMMHAPLSSAIVSDLAPAHLRARYMGVYAICFSAAMMVGAPVGGMILARLGGNYVWGGSAAVGMVAALAFWCVRNRVTPRPDPSAQ